jgi:transcriptional regulator with XRE-family HTH domain
MVENKEIGEITGLPGLKKVRELAGLNAARLAELVGLTGAMISLLESGEKNPSHETLQRLSRVLGCTIEQLNTRPGEYPKPLSDFLATIAPDDIRDDEIEVLRLLRLPGRRITARAYNNLLDAIRNSEKIQ